MIILKLAFRNLFRQARKTILLGSLIAIGIAALFIANAIFQGTNSGLEASIVNSLTGDIVLSQYTDTVFGLFGSEIPVVSEYESLPPIADFSELWPALLELDSLEAASPVVSGAAKISIGSYSEKVALFGIDPESYFSVLKDIRVNSGVTSGIYDRGLFLNSRLASQAEEALGRGLKPGEAVLMSMYSQGSFKLREGYFEGIIDYISPGEALDRVVLADPMLVRALSGYSLGNISGSAGLINGAEQEPLEEDYGSMDFDELFSGAMDVVDAETEGIDLSFIENKLADTEERDRAAAVDSSAWNFVLLKARDGNIKKLEKELNALIKAKGFSVRVLPWRQAAGLSALTIFALQYAFYIGLGFVTLGAVLVIMNALVISVLERIAEIGTMRSLGADRPFIRKLFVAESIILTGLSAVIGILCAIIISGIISKNGIRLENPLLISLFGGSRLLPKYGFASVLFHVSLALLVGAVAWIYPLRLALRIKPINAMN